jgi:hypothetical protein
MSSAGRSMPHFGDHEFLTVRIIGNPGQPERLLLIGRPIDGVVRVREWTSDSWNTEGEDLEMDPRDLLEQLERAYASQLQVSEEMYKIRHWLAGE